MPGFTHLTLWSDSCVSQNRNSDMSFALKRFLVKHPTVRTITQKFCAPGHSSIQEVDNIHSRIEKALLIAEIYSPVSLLRECVSEINTRGQTTRNCKYDKLSCHPLSVSNVKQVCQTPKSMLKFMPQLDIDYFKTFVLS